jgi:hypothetical protein
VKDQPLRTIDDLIAEIKDKSIDELANEPWDGPRLITVDELRAAGALDVPPAWRKSLGADRDVPSGLFDHEDTRPDEQEVTPPDADGDESVS